MDKDKIFIFIVICFFVCLGIIGIELKKVDFNLSGILEESPISASFKEASQIGNNAEALFKKQKNGKTKGRVLEVSDSMLVVDTMAGKKKLSLSGVELTDSKALNTLLGEEIYFESDFVDNYGNISAQIYTLDGKSVQEDFLTQGFAIKEN